MAEKSHYSNWNVDSENADERMNRLLIQRSNKAICVRRRRQDLHFSHFFYPLNASNSFHNNQSTSSLINFPILNSFYFPVI